MLMPKRTKYRRPHRLSYEGRSKAGRTIDFGEYGLVAESGNYETWRKCLDSYFPSHGTY